MRLRNTKNHPLLAHPIEIAPSLLVPPTNLAPRRLSYLFTRWRCAPSTPAAPTPNAGRDASASLGFPRISSGGRAPLRSAGRGPSHSWPAAWSSNAWCFVAGLVAEHGAQRRKAIVAARSDAIFDRVSKDIAARMCCGTQKFHFPTRHCERSEAIHTRSYLDCRGACGSSQ